MYRVVYTLFNRRRKDINLVRSVAEIKAALATKPNATVYSYPGLHHAFARHHRTHYDDAAAALANERTHLLHGVKAK